jgi:hypothetical protein
MDVKGLTKKFAVAGLFAGCIMSASVSLTGCLTDDKKDSTKTPDTSTTGHSTPWGAETVIQVGAQANSAYGSAIDLDAKKALLSSDANKVQGTLDLVFFYSDGEFQIGSPVYAKTLPDVPLAANYNGTLIKDTQIARISTKPDDSQIGASTFATTPQSNNGYVSGGGDYLVKTSEGKIAYVHIGEFQGDGTSATAKFTIALSGL